MSSPSSPGRLQVEQLAGDVLGRDLDVVLALPGGQPRVQLAGLGVDQVGGERAGVAAEQRVRQRAVAPVETGEVQADEQPGQRVEQPGPQVRAGRGR